LHQDQSGEISALVFLKELAGRTEGVEAGAHPFEGASAIAARLACSSEFLDLDKAFGAMALVRKELELLHAVWAEEGMFLHLRPARFAGGGIEKI